MGILDQKKDIFGKIGALNVLNDNFPKLPNFNSLSSITNGTNSTNFLIDLITSLVGFNTLKDTFINTMVYNLSDFEGEIKNIIKSELNEIVSCSINPSLPSWFLNGNEGLYLKVKNIDFFDIMKLDPESTSGSLIYTDVDSGLSSSDYNTFLNNVIQNNNSPNLWGNSTIGEDIIEVTFLETNVNGNNLLKFNSSVTYNDKKLTEFNSNFIDSLTLFGSPNSINSKTLINSLMEELFGSISSSIDVNKSKSQLQSEEEIKEVLNCIINSENNIIDDSFFIFDNPTLAKIGENVTNKKSGVRRLQTCGDLVVKVSETDVSENQVLFDSVTTKEEEFSVVNTILDNLSNIQSSSVNDTKDIQTVNNDFFQSLVEKFNLTIMTNIISPKFLTILAINHKLIYGDDSDFNGGLEFIKLNKRIVKNISNKIINIFLNILLTLAIKELTIKISEKTLYDEIESNKNYISILLSYTGVPPSIISQITGF